MPPIWWTNSIFFMTTHIAGLFGASRYPPSSVPWATLSLCFILWQLGEFGITIGYHRLYAHRSFRATLGVRIILAAMGASAFQGSIKWWWVTPCVTSEPHSENYAARCLRHRLHHRFTDDPIHDPYSATKGLFYSHMGWIFFRPNYPRLKLIDDRDLLEDPVVCFQHKHYVFLALFLGFLVPTFLGYLWNDPWGSFVWGGLITKIAIWHCTFLVNSLAHWNGLQPYSDENTSKGNLILALLTAGEGNHNFHTFPHDFRSGPSWFDWDPSKWIILVLRKLGFTDSLRTASQDDLVEARRYMQGKVKGQIDTREGEAIEWDGEIWNEKDLQTCVQDKPWSCILVIDRFALDVTAYLEEHPGGATLLRRYSVKPRSEHDGECLRDSSWAFWGGLNQHSRAARVKMEKMRIARVVLKGGENN